MFARILLWLRSKRKPTNFRKFAARRCRTLKRVARWHDFPEADFREIKRFVNEHNLPVGLGSCLEECHDRYHLERAGD